jgi:ribosomal protein L18E
MEHLDSPELRDAAQRYAQAARRLSSAPFWRKKTASLELKAQRRAYVTELIRTAETRRIEAQR